MNKKKIILIAAAGVVVLAAAAAALFLFGGGEDKEKEKPVPEAYTVFGRDYPALTTEKAPEIHQGEEPSEGASEEDAEKETEEVQQEENAEETEEINPLPVSYQYTGIADPKAAVKAYAVKLTEEYGFITVDENMRKADMPEKLEAEGDLFLAYKLQNPKELIRVQLSWDAAGCNVTFATIEGEIKPEMRLMTSMEAVDYLKTLPPEDLGLEGDSMEDYNIYALDGGVLVNDEPCIRMNIYRESEKTGTNEIAGCYFLSSVGKKLYRQDVDTGSITDLTK